MARVDDRGGFGASIWSTGRVVVPLLVPRRCHALLCFENRDRSIHSRGAVRRDIGGGNADRNLRITRSSPRMAGVSNYQPPAPSTVVQVRAILVADVSVWHDIRPASDGRFGVATATVSTSRRAAHRGALRPGSFFDAAARDARRVRRQGRCPPVPE